MLRITLAALAACMIVLPATAADIPMRPYFSPAMPATFSWTGMYIGGNAGYSWGKEREEYHDDWTNYDRSIKMNGAVAGGHIGYLHQFGRFVVGVEADWTKTWQKGSSTESECLYKWWGTCQLTHTTVDEPKLEWLGTARIRAGFLPFERLLVYGTVGGAYGMMQNAHAEWYGSGSPLTINTKQALAGYVWGFGGEYALNKNWSVGAEWLRYDLRAIETHTAGWGTNSLYRETVKDDILRGRLTYRF